MEPDLTAFQRLGGKLILYHGWYDQNIAPRNSVNYYQKVLQTMGGEEKTKDFFRLFMVPGMGHCGGGPGPNTMDTLAAMELWVEQKRAPEKIVASRPLEAQGERTRPLCAYPQAARYKGNGSTEDAANFICADPK
jgi:feruloyl esterase